MTGMYKACNVAIAYKNMSADFAYTISNANQAIVLVLKIIPTSKKACTTAPTASACAHSLKDITIVTEKHNYDY